MKAFSTLIAVLMFAGFATAAEGTMTPPAQTAPAAQEAPAHAEKMEGKKAAHAGKKHHGKKGEKKEEGAGTETK